MPNGSNAEAVFGQANFNGSSSNQGGAVAANTLSNPGQIAVDSNGRLWVADTQNHRVLGYLFASLTGNNVTADFVFGQPGFTTNTTPGSASATARNLFSPTQISAGANGSLWVCDTGFFRAVRFSKVKSPRLTITTRSSSTTKAKAPVGGIAAGEVTEVTQRVGSRGPFRKAKGTTKWSFTARLKPGRNPVTVLAQGPGGQSAPKQIVLTRRSTPR